MLSFLFSPRTVLMALVSAALLSVPAPGVCAPARAEDAPPEITLRAVGDIMPGTNFPRNLLPADADSLFRSVRDELRGADIVFGNLESVLTTYERSPKNTGRKMVFAFRTPPSFGAVLRRAGFTALSTANNHSLDFYPRGFEDTMRYVREAGILPVGRKGSIEYTEIKGRKVAFIGFSHYKFHNYINDLPAARALAREAGKKADIVVISFHGGAEGAGALHTHNRVEKFYGEDRGNVVRFSRAMIDAGADLVLGHGPHVPRALEYYRGRLIAYSLGNFVGYRMFSIRGPKGLSLILEVKLAQDGAFRGGRIIPVKLHTPGIPRLDPEGESIRLIQKLSREDFPRSGLHISADGTISGP